MKAPVPGAFLLGVMGVRGFGQEEQDDTIAAIATPIGTGGVAIVRVSGLEALNIADSFLSLRRGRLHELEDRRVYLGHVTDATGKVFDEAVVLVMRGPRSFTGEDTVEVQCHGGRLVSEKVLSLALQNGARLAERGEFTRRAYLSGRISLDEAEAVLEVVEARSESGLLQAGRRLQGELGALIREWESRLLDSLAETQGASDFPEDIPGQREQTCASLEALRKDMEEFLGRGPLGLALSRGIQVCLVGRPNVGKSSLFNSLLRTERAIVTDVPGTTRDVLREDTEWDGLPVTLLDTAGLRLTEEIVEAIGVERAEDAAMDAAVILYVVDDTAGILDDDLRWLERWKDRRLVLVVNKVDLGVGKVSQQRRPEPKGKPGGSQVRVSSLTGEGLEALKKQVTGYFVESGGASEVVPGSARQVECVRRAFSLVSEALTHMEAGWTDDVISLVLEEGARALAELTGKDVSEATLDIVFERFCVGK